jgi:hypothetical protein
MMALRAKHFTVHRVIPLLRMFGERQHMVNVKPDSHPALSNKGEFTLIRQVFPVADCGGGQEGIGWCSHGCLLSAPLGVRSG